MYLGQNLSVAMSQPLNPLSSDKFQRSINEGDFEFLKFLPFDELSMRMSGKILAGQPARSNLLKVKGNHGPGNRLNFEKYIFEIL